jgi:hypothetical protein
MPSMIRCRLRRVFMQQDVTGWRRRVRSYYANGPRGRLSGPIPSPVELPESGCKIPPNYCNRVGDESINPALQETARGQRCPLRGAVTYATYASTDHRNPQL